MQDRDDAGRLGDRGGGAVEVGARGARRNAQQHAVAVAVDADRVAGGGDLRGERRAGAHLLADQEEGRARARAREDVEDRGGALRVRAVVEGQREARQPVGAVRRERRQRRQAPGGAGERRGAERAPHPAGLRRTSASDSPAALGRTA